jgi:hypothetical protein
VRGLLAAPGDEAADRPSLCTAVVALIAAGMVVLSGAALAADTATINPRLGQQRCHSHQLSP